MVTQGSVVGESPDLDPLPDRVLAGKLLLRQGLVDDADLLAVSRSWGERSRPATIGMPRVLKNPGMVNW
jgi:hypothetical protein